MKTPHKHAELIKAWADGAEIEYSIEGSGNWLPCNAVVGWYTAYEYRIKPEPKPDVVRYACYDHHHDDSIFMQLRLYRAKQQLEELKVGQLKLIFDGETRKIKSVEVL